MGWQAGRWGGKDWLGGAGRGRVWRGQAIFGWVWQGWAVGGKARGGKAGVFSDVFIEGIPESQGWGGSAGVLAWGGLARWGRAWRGMVWHGVGWRGLVWAFSSSLLCRGLRKRSG